MQKKYILRIQLKTYSAPNFKTDYYQHQINIPCKHWPRINAASISNCIDKFCPSLCSTQNHTVHLVLSVSFISMVKFSCSCMGLQFIILVALQYSTGEIPHAFIHSITYTCLKIVLFCLFWLNSIYLPILQKDHANWPFHLRVPVACVLVQIFTLPF